MGATIDVTSIEYKTFNELYESGKRFCEPEKVQFLRKLEHGLISGFTLEAIQKGVAQLKLDGEIVEPLHFEKAINYIIFLRMFNN